MKQHITVEQMKEVNDKLFARLMNDKKFNRGLETLCFINPTDEDFKVLMNEMSMQVTIGKMIEILDVKSNYVSMQTILDNADIECWIIEFNDFEWTRFELCDALWEVVKYVLGDN